MKSAVVLSCLAALVYSAYCMDKKEMEDMIEKCKAESGFKGVPKDIHIEGAVKEEKCFIKCMAEKTKFTKKDGTIDMDAAKAAIDKNTKTPTEMKEKFIKVLEECSKEDVYRRAGETGTLAPVIQSVRRQQRRDEEMLRAFDDDPTLSVRRAATRMGVANATVYRILMTTVTPDPSDLCETAYNYYKCKMEKFRPK